MTTQTKKPRELIKHVLTDGTPAEKRVLFGFDTSTSDAKVLMKYKLFVRSCFPRYFQSKAAPFHDSMVYNYIRSYRGVNFLNLAFRGSAKTTHLKLFLVFVLLNDRDHFRKYVKVLSRDLKNPKQIITDVYNMSLEVRDIYGDIFEKEGDKKREETMSGFTTIDGVKFTAGTVGQTQRGHLQDAYRPDWAVFDDVEDRESISSQTITQNIIDKCDEAITGLSKNGSYCVLGNYIYEFGVIQWFLDKDSTEALITPIKKSGQPTWPIYSLEEIAQLEKESEDFYGEYMCDPTHSGDKFFDVDRIDRDLEDMARPPESVSADVRYWGPYQAHHRFGEGADTSEGIGKDSNALAVFDFNTGELVATYHSNTISPDLFAYEIARVGREYGNCIAAPEVNNLSGGIVITTLKAARYENIYREFDESKAKPVMSHRLGWYTTGVNKHTIFHAFRKDYKDGLVKIYDAEVLKEMKSFSKSDLDDRKGSVTRHFDLLTAVVIAWAMKKHATLAETEELGGEDEDNADEPI